MITHSKLTLSSSSFIYTTGQQIVVKKKVEVGRLLIMLQSSKCCKIDQYLANIKEYPHDLGEYFIIKSVGKVILIQEQLSKNWVIIKEDGNGNQCATILSVIDKKVIYNFYLHHLKTIAKTDKDLRLTSNTQHKSYLCIIFGICSDFKASGMIIHHDIGE